MAYAPPTAPKTPVPVLVRGGKLLIRGAAAAPSCTCVTPFVFVLHLNFDFDLFTPAKSQVGTWSMVPEHVM